MPSNGEWQAKQWATPLTRYPPRSTRAAVGSNLRGVSRLLRGPRIARGPKRYRIHPRPVTMIVTARNNATDRLRPKPRMCGRDYTRNPAVHGPACEPAPHLPVTIEVQLMRILRGAERL